jgi:periplasmic protein TonB
MARYKTTSVDWTDVTSIGRNEVVFDGRFKDYGAYFVRVRYNRTLLRAFVIAIAVGVLAISMPVILRALGANKKSDDSVRNVTVHLTAPPPLNPNTPPPPPPPPPPKPLINQLRVTPPVIAHEVIDSIPPPTVHEVQQTNVGVTNQKGKDTIIAPISTGNQVIGDQNDNQILTVVQVMPKFNGDIYKYLGDHIQYPEVERDAGITGTVYVTFVVEKDGSITSVKILRGIPGGPGLDKEAVRVISAMPKWSPGMQNGHSCRVQYNVPIHFELR